MKIKSPIEGFTSKTYVGPLVLDFENGVAEVDEKTVPAGVLGYLQQQGFTVDGKTAKPAELVTPDAPQPTVVDSRDVVDEQVGSKARDAAVDPQPEDFLPPVNAGKADPHGPKVVAPQVHATPEQPVRPGDVSDDNAVQEKAESEHAADNLAETDAAPAKPKTSRASKGAADPVGGLSE